MWEMQKMRDARLMEEFHLSPTTRSTSVCPRARLCVTRVWEHSGEIWLIVTVMTFTGSNTEPVDVQLHCNVCYYTPLKGHKSSECVIFLFCFFIFEKNNQ